MNVLLISGLGPEFPNTSLTAGSAFEALRAPDAHREGTPGDALDLSALRVPVDGRHVPVLRPRAAAHRIRAVSSVRLQHTERDDASAAAPHLTTFTVSAILEAAGVDHELYPTEGIWNGGHPEPAGPFDVVLLSTTFIWDHATMARAIRWIEDRYPSATLVLGGQYSNLKFQQILAAHPFVRHVVRGDAEVALPRLLDALRRGEPTGDIPNLVWRDGDTGRIRLTEVRYADLEALPSPAPGGRYPVIPYESMRGCPFSCKYCSFPAASPKWRYKSAEKIAADFARYRDEHGAQYVKALDSTFTVPPTRLRALLPLLADAGLAWEAYTRANSLKDRSVVGALEEAHCRALAIGFESMNDTTLGHMRKQVKAQANRTAFELLSESSIHHWISFIVGYPGETPELFADTRDFLVNEYAGHFALYVFMLNDETMPVWQDAERFQLAVFDAEGDADEWSHVGMDSATARRLQRETLRDVRWKNDRAIQRTWQHEYELPLLPGRSTAENARVEKLVDRLGMAGADFPDPVEVADRQAGLLAELATHGVTATAAVG
ncbi:B12-binding domain-containing radical SAM protein [Streptomyces hainanensis]|uniref:Radical SAM protein n=1 Tax=Streptomyces hainanensis TaxID=402648 RepID=A0A4R4SW66_9ACTN|nr:radical SAM protein [Streptomyces hainanensis]TDC68461.1 radical SAM protein [Streptomyces hainanensis]